MNILLLVGLFIRLPSIIILFIMFKYYLSTVNQKLVRLKSIVLI